MSDDLPALLATVFPFVHLLCSADEVRLAYEQMLGRARSELVMFTRPPYAWQMPDPNPAVLAALGRGVSARALYLSSEWAAPAAGAFREEMAVYHGAGVQPRLADELPVKLVVVDGEVALIAIPNRGPAAAAYPPALLVDEAGFATVQAAAFERVWDTARLIPMAGCPA